MISIISLIILFTASALTQANSNLQEDTIDRLRKTLEQYKKIDLIASSQSRLIQSDGKVGSVVEDLIVGVKRADPQALISSKSRLGRPGEDVRPSQNDLTVYANGDILSSQAALNASLQQMEDTTDDLSLLLHSERLAGKQQFDRQSVYNNLNDAGIILWIVGYTHLMDYIDSATEIKVTPTDEGARIQATSEHGLLTLNVSSTHDWLPHSFEIIKGPEHKTVGGTVSEVYENTVKFVVWTGEVKEFTNNGTGNLTPAKIVVRRRTVPKTGTPQSIETNIDFQQVIFNPHLTDADFRSNIIAPIGFNVGVAEASHLPYEWDGEKPVPRVAGLGEIVGSFFKDRVWGRGGLIGINVLFLCVVLYLLWRRQATA